MFIPYSTERQLRRLPWATLALIGLNVLAAAVTWPNMDAMKPLILDPDNFHIWQPVTALFMHAGPFHLAGNMLFLWIFGSHMEDVLGAGRFLAVYFSAGFAADIAQAGFDHLVLQHIRGSLGASGAVMGLVAIFVTRFRSVRVNIFYWWWFWLGTWRVKALWVASAYIAMDVLSGFLGLFGVQGSVAHFAHLGGFACGILWGYGMRLPDEAAFEESREEIGRKTAYSPSVAASSAAALVEKRPDDPRSQWLAAVHLAADSATFDRAVEHWNAALQLWLAWGQDQEVLERWRWLANRYDASRMLHPEVVSKVAGTFESAGDSMEACRIYGALASDHPDHQHAPQWALHVADILDHRGKKQQARTWYDYVQRRWPDSYQALDARSRMYAIDDQLD